MRVNFYAMKTQIALSALSIELNGTAPSEIQLLPDGLFKAKDGRPQGLDGWFLDEKIAQAVIQHSDSQADAFVIDYDHQSLYAKQNGMPAPAAGWFKNLEYRKGVGLFATQVEWTDSAALAIQNKEYRYISPVLTYDTKTGAVQKILMSALVNVPALDGMKDLTALAQQFFNTEALSMDLDELLERLRYLFNLPTLATVDEIKAQMDKLRTLMDAQPTDTAAASSIFTLLENQSKIVDLSQHVPISNMKPLQEQITALSLQNQQLAEQINAKERHEIIGAALSDGRLLPNQEAWAQKLGENNLAALKEFLDVAKPLDIAGGTQTGGKAPADDITALKVKVPTGWGVDENQAALHQEITAYQRQHNVDYTTAALALGDSHG